MAQIGIREVNIANEVAVALARSACVGFLAMLIGLFVASFLLRVGKPFRWLVWTLLIAPYAMPTLLVGYHYANTSLQLPHDLIMNQLLYAVLLWLKLAPIAALIFYFSARPLSAQAAHCLRLSAAGAKRLERLRQECSIWLLARGRAALTAFVLVFLFAFADFELASLLWTRNWTVVIFDAQVGGISLNESFRWIVLPLIVQTIVVATLITLISCQKFGAFQPKSFAVKPLGLSAILPVTYLAIAFVVVVGIPLAAVVRDASSGLSVLEAHLAFCKEIGAGVLFAGVGSIAAYWVAGKLTEGSMKTGKMARLVVVSLPGLVGALVLSLAMLALFQLPILSKRIFDPLRLPSAFALLMMPFAILLRLTLLALRPASASRVAEIMRQGGGALKQRADEILWQLERRKHFWACAVLFCWAFYDLTASSLLAPADMQTAMARLYNFTHYGRISGLSALIVVTVMVPVVLALIVAGLRGVWSKWRYA